MKKTAYVSWITKIADCIQIVCGLPYNYKPNLSLKSQAVRLAQCLLRDNYAIQSGSHVAEPDTLYRLTVNKMI